jgi:hypothetical protein
MRAAEEEKFLAGLRPAKLPAEVKCGIQTALGFG